MKAWKVTGKLHIPKNIMFDLNSPSGVVKAAFHWSFGLMSTLLYPYHTSNLVKVNDPCSLLMRSEMRGRG